LGWSISLTIGLAGGGTIGGLWLFLVPMWGIVAWSIVVAMTGAALMFWQLKRGLPASKALRPHASVETRAAQWIRGRWAVLLLLIIGAFGPWTSCRHCIGCSSGNYYNQNQNLPQLLWEYDLFATQFVAPILLLFIVTLLFLVCRNLRNSAGVIWLERIAATGSLIALGLMPWVFQSFSDPACLWGLWVTTAGAVLAALNLIGEWITTRKRPP
jgi:hypothetical protein